MRLAGVALGFSLVLTLGLAGFVAAQIKYDRGQNVQPVFEGWERNSDGSFSLLFGYLNRNYEERPSIPVGAQNLFEPGDPDRGQPTHFYPRRQSFVFKVRVPADFGDRDLVWTVTHNGRTDKAYGSLWPVWEIDASVVRANRGMGIKGAYVDNRPPRIERVGPPDVEVALADTLSLSVDAGDDGIPGPNPEAAKRRGRNQGRDGPNTQNVVNPRAAVATGLAVTWLQHRGPGRVSFDPMTVPVEAGRASTTARFSKPGTYVLRAVADDTQVTTAVDVTVTVRP